ncbi:MAG: hypothetical protein WBQ78_02965 [Gammaproteobacteria bacterium]
MMCKTCWSIAALLALLSAGVIYKFGFQGSVSPGTDGRTAILLEPGERDLVLSEMRVFLESTQQITAGIAGNDMPRAAQHARRSGRAAQQAVPGSLMGKLPLSFKQLGLDTHTKFDELALDAEQLGDQDHTLSQLNTLLQNCVACHAAYRIELAQ